MHDALSIEFQVNGDLQHCRIASTISSTLTPCVTTSTRSHDAGVIPWVFKKCWRSSEKAFNKIQILTPLVTQLHCNHRCIRASRKSLLHRVLCCGVVLQLAKQWLFAGRAFLHTIKFLQKFRTSLTKQQGQLTDKRVRSYPGSNWDYRNQNPMC